MEQLRPFDLLKVIAINEKYAEDYIEDFKYLFKNEIGSSRNMERIKNMVDLIDCLERHDALSENNIEPLREIADQCGGQLEQAVTEYFVPKQEKTEPENDYRKIRLSEQLKPQLNLNSYSSMDSPNLNNDTNHTSNRLNQHKGPSINSSANNNNGNSAPPPSNYTEELTEKKRSAIYKLIAGEIGIKYRSLGRALGLGEGALDGIEIEYRDVVSRVHKILQTFEEDGCQDHKQDVVIICRALDDCRRKDLSRKIGKIMSQ